MEIPELIAKENIQLVWPLFGPRVQKAIDKFKFAEYDLPMVFNLLQQGNAQLWVGGTGEMIAITRIEVYPHMKRLAVDFIDGVTPEQYTEHMEYIEHWAISLGATQASAELRPGLWKFAKSQGWEKQRIKVFKNLIQGLH